ncbi:MAG: N-acetyltransferase family protein [Tepidiformaceae bacterium]
MSPSIRPATVADIPAINAIYNFYVATSPATFDIEPTSDASRNAWFQQRTARGLPILVAEARREISGWCALSDWSPKGAYETTKDESIYVADAFRGHGVGRALLTAIIDEARRLGVQVVMAGVVACQEPSLALHRSLGFEQSALNLHMGYKLGAWHDVAYLQKHLWR